MDGNLSPAAAAATNPDADATANPVFTSRLCKDTTQMAKLRFRAVVRHAMFAIVTTVAVAKIVPPKPVAPVIGNGVRDYTNYAQRA